MIINLFLIKTYILYYLKCAFNLIFSFFNFFNYYNEKNIKNNNFVKINDYLHVVKLNGSYIEMGKQYGKSMKDILIKDTNTFLKFIDNKKIYNRIPNNLKKKTVYESILNYYEINKNNFNQDLINFTEGVSKSTNISFNDLIILNCFSDLMDNHCILLSKKINNDIFSLRTLDYGSPQLNQVLIVFKPLNKIKYVSLNVSFNFNIFTGYSENGLFFGESYNDDIIDYISYIGMPFGHISHKLLSECRNLEESENLLRNTLRKSNLELLISDKNNSKIFLSCNSKLEEYKSGDFIYSASDNEKKKIIKNKKYLNNIENIINNFIPNLQSGELHIMIKYKKYIYVSTTTKIYQSYNNNFTKILIQDLFN